MLALPDVLGLPLLPSLQPLLPLSSPGCTSTPWPPHDHPTAGSGHVSGTYHSRHSTVRHSHNSMLLSPLAPLAGSIPSIPAKFATAVAAGELIELLHAIDIDRAENPTIYVFVSFVSDPRCDLQLSTTLTLSFVPDPRCDLQFSPTLTSCCSSQTLSQFGSLVT